MKVKVTNHEYIEVEYSETEREAVHKAMVNGDWNVIRSGPKIKDFVAVPDTFLVLANRPLTKTKTTDKIP